MNDKYAVIKGKALTMCREFKKVYPKEYAGDRIANEVWFAANVEFPNAREINTELLHRIIDEIRSECL